MNEDGGRLTLRRRDFVEAPGIDAHAAWAAGGWPSVAGVFASRPLEPFYSHAAFLRLGEVVVQYAAGSARALERSAAQIAADRLSALAVGVHFNAPVDCDAGGPARTVAPGALLFLDLAQCSRVVIPASRSLQLAVPRPLAEEYLGSVAKLHGRVVPAVAGVLLVAYLDSVRQAAGTLAGSHAPRLGRVALDLLAVAARQDRRLAAARHPAGGPAAVRAGIEASLDLPGTTIAALCQRLGVSRSTLSRMFREEGGIEAHLRNLRLERVRMALIDSATRPRIGALAERWGFTDASHLTRAFRARYGVTPTAMRVAAERPADALGQAKLTR